MATLVVGASGLVGYEFFRQKKESKGWYFTYSQHKLYEFIQLDATDYAQVKRLVDSLAPDVLILTAAMADVNRCETERELAYRHNVGIVENLLKALDGSGCKIVFFSTDYLFDGKAGPYSEDDVPNPINYYGHLKLMCEQAIRSSGMDHLIVRTTGVFGREMHRKNFLYRVLDTLGAKKPLIVPNDQFGTPTYVRDLVSATLQLLERGESGVFNVVGGEWLSREAIARRFAVFFGLDKSLVIGKPTSHFTSAAPRPLKAGLKNDRLASLGIRTSSIEEALTEEKTKEFI